MLSKDYVYELKQNATKLHKKKNVGYINKYNQHFCLHDFINTFEHVFGTESKVQTLQRKNKYIYG